MSMGVGAVQGGAVPGAAGAFTVRFNRFEHLEARGPCI